MKLPHFSSRMSQHKCSAIGRVASCDRTTRPSGAGDSQDPCQVDAYERGIACYGLQMTSRILIVEDDPLVAIMIEDFLDALGYELAGCEGSFVGALARLASSDLMP